ncbi:antimicrobial peptide NK-lysin-like protein [Labeo rohita]|uniref:Antimicrobial peptide NK-lysin-like protein n=1 Tax=Labeo rohita TaxID=84645 RepID=A0A498LJL4_LABRO|nr:antimicrobial peptide NK-lysin-like protein [Labeo rohita]
MLNNICDQFKPLRGPCKGIVEKHLGNLISELMTNDGPKAACIKIHACKKGEIQAEQFPGVCWACKWAMGKLKSQMTKGMTKNDIKNMLGMVCDEIGFLKYLCRMFVNKFMGTLIEELSTSDNARTICVNIGVC